MKRVMHEHTQVNVASPATVFPLLCPVREAEWVPGWRHRMIYSNSGFAEQNCVFSTPNPEGSDTTWVVTHYDPTLYQISFAWLWPDMIATVLQIQLAAGEKIDTTLSRIRYTYTALTQAGELELSRYTRRWFEDKMKGWEMAMNHYLQTGKCVE